MNILTKIIDQDKYFEGIKSHKNVILYGAGNKARQTIELLKERGIIPCDVCDGNEELWGQAFAQDYMIKSYRKIRETYRDYCIIVAATIKNALEIVQVVDAEVPCYHVCSPFKIESGFLEKQSIERDRDEYETVYSVWQDEKSKRIYIENINSRLSGNFMELHKLEDGTSFFDEQILRNRADGVYVDVGAYTGDTLCRFLEYAGTYKKMIAVEADRENCECMRQFVKYGRIRDVKVIHSGVWSEEKTMQFYTTNHKNDMSYDMSNFYRSTDEQADNRTLKKCAANAVEMIVEEMKVDTLDHLLQDERPTLMKINAMAADLPILEGAKQIITKFRPDIILEYGVRPAYLIDEIKYLNDLDVGYRFYLRQKNIYGDTKTILYAIGSDENA